MSDSGNTYANATDSLQRSEARETFLITYCGVTSTTGTKRFYCDNHCRGTFELYRAVLQEL